MNANELADELDKMIPVLPLNVLIKSATMLRQQQAEIEALKLRELSDDEIKEVYDQYFDLENFGWLHLQCIRAILKKASEK